MASTDPVRPNILVVLTDDQGPWALPAAGARELRHHRVGAAFSQPDHPNLRVWAFPTAVARRTVLGRRCADGGRPLGRRAVTRATW
jgi:arylsulfatase A-like enzyme